MVCEEGFVVEKSIHEVEFLCVAGENYVSTPQFSRCTATALVACIRICDSRRSFSD